MIGSPPPASHTGRLGEGAPTSEDHPMRRQALLTALAAGVLLLSTSRLPARPPKATTGLAALEKYLIDDVALVGVVNVKAITASPMYAKVKKEVAAVVGHAYCAKHLKVLGVAPLENVERIVFVMGQAKV